MTKLIALDDGHGIDTPGKRTPTLPNGQKSELGRPYMNENLFNRAVVKYLDEELKRHGFKTLLVAPTDADTSLAARVAAANKAGAHLYVSVHANANRGEWGSHGGIETFVWPSGESQRIGRIIHKHLLKGTPLRDRGVKDGRHLYVINSTKMPAVLVEAGFMDSTTDYVYLLSDAYRRECAREIAQGICEAYNVKYNDQTAPAPAPTPAPKPTPPPKVEPAPANFKSVYRVVVGSFTKRDEAISRQKALKAKGYDTMLIAYTTNGTTYLRVVCGSFTVKANAESMQRRLKSDGFDSFLAYQKYKTKAGV